MAAIDFPSNPTTGQTFTAANVTWSWDGFKWVAASGSQGVFLPVTGGTLTGPLILNADPTVPLGAATKQYTDNSLAPYALTATVNATFLPLAGGTLTGNLGIKPSGSAILSLVKPSGAANVGAYISAYTLNSLRWVMYLGDGTAESANGGGNFVLERHNDAGAAVDQPLSISRLNGQAAFAQNVSMSGALSVGANITEQYNGIVYSKWNAAAIGFAWQSPQLALYLDGGLDGIVVLSPNTNPPTYAVQAFYFQSGSNIGCINVPGSSWNWPCNGSDRRLKSNIKPTSIDALALLGKVKVYEADLNSPIADEPSRHWDCALIADELEDLIPRAYIKGTPAEGDRAELYDNINELPLVCTLVKAVQQLTEKLDAANARIAALEARR
jgi:hypothetical protein